MKATTEVLLVDDNPGDVDLTADVLSRHNYPSHIHSVVDGVEAMAFLHSEGKYVDASPPHLIILDVNMPRKNGLTMIAAAKSDPNLRKIPIVIFSASLARADVARSYDLGANSYVGKPGDLHGFVAAVTAIGDFWFGAARVAGRGTGE